MACIMKLKTLTYMAAGAPPVLGNRPVDLSSLYREVGRRGGADVVTERKLWKAIARALGLDESAKVAATLRSTFDALLASYARR